MKYIIPLFLLVLCFYSYAIDYNSFKDVPDPKKQGTGYVSNPDNIIPSNYQTYIDSLIADNELKTGVQIAVVALNSIGSNDPFNFGVDLFEYWGVGNKDKGLLLMVTMSPKSWRFHTGYGIEAVLTDAELKTIGEQYLVPEFKQGNFGKGISDAIYQVTLKLQSPAETAAEESTSYYTDESTDYDFYSDERSIIWGFYGLYLLVVIVVFIVYFFNKPKPGSKPRQIVKINMTEWILFYVILPLFCVLTIYLVQKYEDPIGPFLITIYGWMNLVSFHYRYRKNMYVAKLEITDSYEKYKAVRTSHKYVFIAIFFFPLIYIPYIISYLRKLRNLRNQPRLCEICNDRMTKLNEKADDTYLSGGQLKEESLGSVDYDVWICNNGHTKIFPYDAFLTSYKKCPGCGFVTLYMAENKTIVAPTYTSTGKGQKTYKCKNCSHVKTETYTIPKRTKSSSTGGYGSSRSSGNSSRSYSGSSSWGGGRTGGGGAGGSW